MGREGIESKVYLDDDKLNDAIKKDGLSDEVVASLSEEKDTTEGEDFEEEIKQILKTRDPRIEDFQRRNKESLEELAEKLGFQGSDGPRGMAMDQNPYPNFKSLTQDEKDAEGKRLLQAADTLINQLLDEEGKRRWREANPLVETPTSEGLAYKRITESDEKLEMKYEELKEVVANRNVEEMLAKLREEGKEMFENMWTTPALKNELANNTNVEEMLEKLRREA